MDGFVPNGRVFHARRLNVHLFVDIGGGAGFDVERLRKHLIHTEPGALVLQDLRPIIERAVVYQSVKTMVHNSFDEQPIKGLSCSN